MSVEYYSQLERGNLRGVSASVLDALARALHLAAALFAPVFADPVRPANHARFNFLDPRTRSDAFRVRRAARDVRLHRTGLKHIRHPVVGELHLSYDVLELPADPGQTLIAFSAEPGSPDDDAIRLLAGVAATQDGQPARITRSSTTSLT